MKLFKDNFELVYVRLQTTVQVIQLWSDEVETDDVGSGENVRMKLKGIEDTDVLAGFVLCAIDSPCKVGRIFDAEVSATLLH